MLYSDTTNAMFRPECGHAREYLLWRPIVICKALSTRMQHHTSRFR